MDILESSKLLMIIDQERLSFNSLVELTSALLSHQDLMLRLESLRSGQLTSSHPDNLDISFYQQAKESSLMMKLEKDTLEAKLLASSIDRFTLTPRC